MGAKSVFVVVAAALGLGCSSGEVERSPPTSVTVLTGGTPSTLYDAAQLEGIVQSMLEVEVREAELAEAAPDPEIRHYAQMMKTEFERALATEQSVLVSAKPRPETSEASRQIGRETQNAEKALQGRSGYGLEETFLSRDVALQTRLLSLIDNELLTSVSSPAQRTELLRVRPLVARRLNLSSRLQEWLLTQP